MVERPGLPRPARPKVTVIEVDERILKRSTIEQDIPDFGGSRRLSSSRSSSFSIPHACYANAVFTRTAISSKKLLCRCVGASKSSFRSTPGRYSDAGTGTNVSKSFGRVVRLRLRLVGGCGAREPEIVLDDAKGDAVTGGPNSVRARKATDAVFWEEPHFSHEARQTSAVDDALTS